MDINQLKYFVAIVNNDFNLSNASKKLHLSQPALSKYILKFEEEEKVQLFKRKNGRLAGLTPAGENFYNNAISVLDHHAGMLKELREHSTTVKGSVRIGIPPLILTVLFTEVMSRFISLNPTIRFEIIELGAFELRKMLLLNELDFALLLTPTNLSPLIYEEVLIRQDELTAFMSAHNPLAEKEVLSWSDLRGRDLAIFNETFMIHHQLMRKFDALKMDPKISLMSGSWDFLLEVTRTSDFITILPSPIRHHFFIQEIKERHFDAPINWNVVLTYPIKTHYTQIERYVKKSIVEYFTMNKEIQKISTS